VAARTSHDPALLKPSLHLIHQAITASERNRPAWRGGDWREGR
jgi:hypothetical protein